MAESGTGFVVDTSALAAAATGFRELRGVAGPAVAQWRTAMEALRGGIGDDAVNRQYADEVLPGLDLIAASMVEALGGWADLLEATVATYQSGDTASLFH